MAYIIRKLPKTGQTTSYVDYDDGYYQKGSPISPRLVDNGDGTITDRVTNLMWVKQPELIIPGASVRTDNQIQVAKGNYANSTAYAVADLVYDAGGDTKYYVCVSAHTSNGANITADLVNNPNSWRETVWTASAADLTTPSTMLWADTITNSEALDYAGHSDWRLPNAKELMSIVDYGRFSPAIDPLFTSQSDFYWSSTTYAGFAISAWYVHFDDGYVNAGSKAGSAYYVRPVRSIN